jgi:hypothetical protein
MCSMVATKLLGWLPVGKLWALSLSKRHHLVRPGPADPLK